MGFGKLKREVRRLTGQLEDLFELIAAQPRRVRYDRHRGDLVRRTEGRQPIRPETAVLLIRQPDGVLQSTFYTLSWLGRQGVSAVVVSNAPLTGPDRLRLSQLCHLVIERPNLGYDFGGYREGILTLLERAETPEALYLLNDSIWFPLWDDCDALDRARASKSDLFGLVLNTNRHKVTYLQSYFLRIGPDLLQSRDFQRYWRTMPLICKRHLVVRRLELRLTGYFAAKGYDIGCLHSRKDLTDCLLSLDDASLRACLLYMVEANEQESTLLQRMLADGTAFSELRPRIEDLIRSGVVQRTFAYADPGLLSRLRVPFLKKARKPRGVAQRFRLCKQGLDQSFAPEVRTEISVWDRP